MLFQRIRLSTCVWSLGPRGALICLIRWAGPLSRADGISSFSMFLPVLGTGGKMGAESVFLIKTCTGSWSALLPLAPKGVSRAAFNHTLLARTYRFPLYRFIVTVIESNRTRSTLAGVCDPKWKPPGQAAPDEATQTGTGGARATAQERNVSKTEAAFRVCLTLGF